MSSPHTSVLLNEILKYFEGRKLRHFVDCTLGAGGHSAAILEAHPEIECLIGLDQDPEALNIAKERLSPWKTKTKLFLSNFTKFSNCLDQAKIPEVDGILFDLGVSSMQLDRPEKGFSFSKQGPLDMRMDPENPISAQEIVNSWSEKDLGRVFREFGEEKQWRAAARAIVAARAQKPLLTTADLSNTLMPILSRKAKKGINPLTLVFQGLRICVNSELEVLEETLPRSIERLSAGGRLAVISFHSLEDRIVKNILRYEADDKENTAGLAGLFLNKRQTIKLLTKKPVEATEEEVEVNPRSRSAKLRVAEKI